MSKDLFIAAHEELIEQYLEDNPGSTWDEAYDKCADAAYDRMYDMMADKADHMRKLKREEGY
jgi:hypothetical protein